MDIEELFELMDITEPRRNLVDRRIPHEDLKLGPNDPPEDEKDYGRFISVQSAGVVYAMYFDPVRIHTATAMTSGKGGREDRHGSKTQADPGLWAVASINSGPFGADRTFYDYFPPEGQEE